MWAWRPADARGHGLAEDFGLAVRHQVANWSGIPTASAVGLLVAGLLLLAASAVVAERLTAPFLRCAEGYWPGGRPRWLWRLLVRLAGWQRRRRRRQWSDIRHSTGAGGQDRTREGVLAMALHRTPPEDLLMPTAFGNVLRAGELRPTRRYGLEAVVVWPRLWLVLPETARQEITGARARVDTAARAIMWAAAAVVWATLLWWVAPVAVVLAFALYRASLLPAAETYADLVEAAFDVHRFTLYESLRLPVPEKAGDEPGSGRTVTTFLWEGHLAESVVFRAPPA
jgi:hypothetical protein